MFATSAENISTYRFEKAGPNYSAALVFNNPLLTWRSINDLVEMEVLSGLLLADIDVLQLHWDAGDLH